MSGRPTVLSGPNRNPVPDRNCNHVPKLLLSPDLYGLLITVGGGRGWSV